MARPLGVLMSLPMITSTLAPFREALMMLGDCSFQLVQNMRLGWEQTQGKYNDVHWELMLWLTELK